ncbi:MAG: hypothetical protein ACRDJE_17150 [Dehalococcoidia bacterium]
MVKRTEREVAARCLWDPAYAFVVLDAEDYPAVRTALQADLEEAGQGQIVVNPSPIPPDAAWWQRLAFPRLRALAERPANQPA